MERPFPQTIVCQLGARRHYAVPLALHQAGLLERLYTDLYSKQTWRSAFLKKSGVAKRIPAFRRWSGRSESTLPDDKVRTFSRFGWSYKARAAASRSRGGLTGVWMWGGKRFGRLACRAGLGEADAVYAYTSAALEIFEFAKSRGIKCILDHATAPRRNEMDLVDAQYRRYHEWSDGARHDAFVDAYTDRQHQEAQLADVILCGSSFVRNLVEEAWGFGWKCVVVPLGLRLSTSEDAARSPHAGPLRVLFAGDEAMRKGIGDLHTAIKLAGKERFDVRVVGRIDLNAHGRKVAGECMELLGPIPRSEMVHHYRWADVLALPSVSDTFALVVPEAMSHGVPIVTTTHVGAADLIRTGVDGLIVPPNQTEQLADALLRLANDRSLVSSMSENAKRQVQSCTLAEYSNRLVQAIQSPSPVACLSNDAAPTASLSVEKAASP